MNSRFKNHPHLTVSENDFYWTSPRNMRRNRPLDSHSFQRFCTECNALLSVCSFNSPTRCENCKEPVKGFTCTGTACKFSKEEYVRCGCGIRRSEKNIKRREVDVSEERIILHTILLYAGLSIFLIVSMYYLFMLIFPMKSHEDMNAEIKRLKTHYTSQKNETWYHFLSVLENKIPSVKSITFLHGEDKKTLSCLTNELVSLYTNNKTKAEQITFSLIGSEVRDYGFFLEHYHAIVEKFRVLITDLNKVPGSTARMFHTLCDEESSDIKPSLFIFTLKYDKKTADLKPLERATTILKEAWGNLPQNEIFPLLSRIIKNVVDVVPEWKVNCRF